MNVSLNLDRGTLGLGSPQQAAPSNSVGGTGRPQDRESALNALVKSMTDPDGKVNGDNPLVKLLTEILQNIEKKASQAQGGGQAPSGNVPGDGTSPKSMSPDQLKDFLSQLLQMLSGSDGAGAGGNGFGGGASSNGLGGPSGGAGGAGGADVLSQLLGLLTQEKLGSLLQPSTDGGATFEKGDKELLKEVAQFMDQSGAFGKPNNADGNVKSWVDELNEKGKNGEPDDKLNPGEADKFLLALKMLGEQAASGAAPASGMLANSGTPMSSGEGSSAGGGFGGGFGGGSGGGFGGNVGNSGGFGGGQNVTISGSAEEISQLLQGLGAGGAQAQAVQEDARNTAGSIMNKLFS